MLTAQAIRTCLETGEIKITPFKSENIQPNSYDLTLAPTVLRIISQTLDIRHEPTWDQVYVDNDWMQLRAGRCYLATHQEYIEAPKLIMTLHGRSTLARYFVSIHESAGFGDIGFKGHWTLELVPKMDIQLKVGMKIAQIAFIRPDGPINSTYPGDYIVDSAIPKLPKPGNF